MSTKTETINKIKLDPVFAKDKVTGDYVVHYKRFSNASAMGKTKEEAELNLLEILIQLLTNRKEKIREQALNDYYTD
jgi:predicted RNase H-like HicB family nuclease